MRSLNIEWGQLPENPTLAKFVKVEDLSKVLYQKASTFCGGYCAIARLLSISCKVSVKVTNEFYIMPQCDKEL